MDRFELTRTPEGDTLRVPRRGTSLLRYPLYNKGTGFTPEERRRLGLEGLLPSQHNDIETQARRVYRSIMFNPDPLGRHIDLAALQDRNEHLYYKVLSLHLEELLPIVYTPTVGKASQYFSRVYRRGRGIWITPEYRGRIRKILKRGAPFSGVQLMVVTDNESILGIGDQGAGGMAISVGKLALYCAGAGIHPARTLPISLDVGTSNRTLLEDPMYLGWRQPRLRGADYLELLDEFVAAARNVFPDVVIQWEDFRKENALAILDRYRDRVPSFNDDIQGTGAVALACVLAACRLLEAGFAAQRILVYGAGAAGLGIARQLRQQFERDGLAGDALRRAILVMDSHGIVHSGRAGLDAYKQELAWPGALVADLGLEQASFAALAEVVAAYRPTVLIGTSGQAEAFGQDTVRAMLSGTSTPIILPLSNPTSNSEAQPEYLLRWSEGAALVATGSPYEPVAMRGGTQRIAQANNVFIFPGLGLGTIVGGASRVTDDMISAAAMALAHAVQPGELESRCLMPEVARLWDVSGQVGIAVALQAVEEGVAPRCSEDELRRKLEAYRWRPVYPTIVEA